MKHGPVCPPQYCPRHYHWIPFIAKTTLSCLFIMSYLVLKTEASWVFFPYIFSSICMSCRFELLILDYEAVVKLSDGFNGADLRNVCTEAGLSSVFACIPLTFLPWNPHQQMAGSETVWQDEYSLGIHGSKALWCYCFTVVKYEHQML